MKPLIRSVLCTALSLVCAANTPAANSFTDGGFTGVSVTSSGATGPSIYGEFGNGSGSTLSMAGWSTSGYNFVFLPNGAGGTYLDAGLTATTNGVAAGPNAGVPAETGGQYPNLYVYGSQNTTGAAVIPTIPGYTGNYVASDGAFEVGAINQTITGLVLGNTYEVNFYWAAAQQQSFTGATTENWTVAFGTAAQISGGTAPQFTTQTFSLPSTGFSGWMAGTTSTGGKFDFTASSTSEVLSFLATGTPTGEPPFSLLADVSVNQVPEPSGWLFLVLSGTALTILAVLRRRLARRAAPLGPNGGLFSRAGGSVLISGNTRYGKTRWKGDDYVRGLLLTGTAGARDRARGNDSKGS